MGKKIHVLEERGKALTGAGLSMREKGSRYPVFFKKKFGGGGSEHSEGGGEKQPVRCLVSKGRPVQHKPQCKGRLQSHRVHFLTNTGCDQKWPIFMITLLS